MDSFIKLVNSDTGKTIHIKAKDIIALQRVDSGNYTSIYIKTLPFSFTVKESCEDIFKLMEAVME